MTSGSPLRLILVFMIPLLLGNLFQQFYNIVDAMIVGRLLGGLDERLHTPRLATPRIKIDAGSVGIGGSQTGIYPMDSPGGWQLMGMTPVKTYDPERETPILFEAGDYIRFVPVHEDEYLRIKEQVARGEYECTIREGEV